MNEPQLARRSIHWMLTSAGAFCFAAVSATTFGMRKRSSPSRGLRTISSTLMCCTSWPLSVNDWSNANLTPPTSRQSDEDEIVVAVAPHPVGIEGADASRQPVGAEQHVPGGVVALIGHDRERLAVDRLVGERGEPVRMPRHLEEEPRRLAMQLALMRDHPRRAHGVERRHRLLRLLREHDVVLAEHVAGARRRTPPCR